MILARLAFADGHRVELLVSDDVRTLSIPQARKPSRIFTRMGADDDVAVFREQRLTAPARIPAKRK